MDSILNPKLGFGLSAWGSYVQVGLRLRSLTSKGADDGTICCKARHNPKA